MIIFFSFISLFCLLVNKEIKYLRNNFKQLKSSEVLFSKEGIPLRNILIEKKYYCFPVKLKNISIYLKDAVIVAEDKRFYKHLGIDIIALIRAFYQNISELKVVSGASTITSQLIKLKFKRKRTFYNKLKEFFQALLVERIFSKNEILEKYLNRIYFGNMNIGIRAASLFYFNKSQKYLSIKESAILAALIRSPAKLDPYKHYLKVELKANNIIRKMYEQKYISKEQMNNSILEKPEINFSLYENTMTHYYRYLKKINSYKLKTKQTQIKYYLQQKIQKELNKYIDNNEQINNGAVLIYDIKTKSYNVYCGNSTENILKKERSIDSALSKRQSGSILKPFLYYLSLNNGYYPQKKVFDKEIEFKEEKGIFIPKNYDRKYYGKISFRQALACSRNIPAVKLLENIGKENFLEFLKKIGFNSLSKTPEYYGLSLILGGGEITLDELVKAYCFFPETIKNKNKIYENAYIISDILADNKARENAFGNFNFPFKLSLKTGTSEGFHDSWAVCFSLNKIFGIWLGNLNRKLSKKLKEKAYALELIKKVVDIYNNENNDIIEIKEPDNIKKGYFCSVCGGLTLKNKGIRDIYYKNVKKCNCNKKIYFPVKIISPLNKSVFIKNKDIPDEYQKIKVQCESFSNELIWKLNNKIINKNIKEFFINIKSGNYIIEVSDKITSSTVEIKVDVNSK